MLAWSHSGSCRCGEVFPHLSRRAAKTWLGSRAFQWPGLAPELAAQRVTGAVALLCQPLPAQQCSHPPDLRGTAGQYSRKRRALGGNVPPETRAAPRARHGVCVQAAAETRLSHPRCRGRAMERGPGRTGASPGAPRLFTDRDAERPHRDKRVEGKLGLQAACVQGEGLFQSRGYFLRAFLWAFKTWSSEVLTILPERPYGLLDLRWIRKQEVGKGCTGDTLPCSSLALAAMRASSFCERSLCDVAGA